MTVQTDQPTTDAVTVSQVDWAPVPRVNLLPPEILRRREFRRAKIRLAGFVVLTLILAAAGVAWAQQGVTEAQSALDGTAAETAVLRHAEAKYADVPNVLAQVQAVKTARQNALGSDVLWYRFMTDISASTPANVSLDTVTITLNGAGSAASAGLSTDVLIPSGIGTVTFGGSASTMDDVAAWMDAVGRVSGVDGASLKSATRDPASNASVVKFSATVVITSAALSHRFDPKAG